MAGGEYKRDVCVCVYEWVKCVASLQIYNCKQWLMIHLNYGC